MSFMFNSNHHSRIKNDKILRWHLELSCYSFDIIYRPGVDNTVADAFSRASCASVHDSYNSLLQLHCSLCHPGITHMMAFIRSKNLPYSLEEVKKVISTCKICNECKPKYYKPE